MTSTDFILRPKQEQNLVMQKSLGGTSSTTANEWDETAFVYSKRTGITYMKNN